MASKTEILKQSWRPALMFVFIAIIINSYIILPYIGLIFKLGTPAVNMPEHMWDIIKLSVGAYVVGRSAEKSITNWKGNGSK